MQTIRVRTKEPYNVLVGAGILHALGCRAAELSGKHYRKAALVCDETVYRLYGETAKRSLERAGLETVVADFPPGAISKGMNTALHILDTLASKNFSKTDLVVALGGGVSLALGGFSAALYCRGIDYIQVPTTLLAAVDSTVGGEADIDLTLGTGLVGVVYPPQLVLCDTDAFQSLDARFWADGLAEIVRFGCVGGRDLFERLESIDPRREIIGVIARAAEIKAGILADDPDGSRRQILRFGKLMAGGVERISRYRLTGGQAGAIGMCLTAEAGVCNGLLAASEADRLRAVLAGLGLPVKCGYSAAEICREALRGTDPNEIIPLVTLEQIGKAAICSIQAGKLHSFFAKVSPAANRRK